MAKKSKIVEAVGVSAGSLDPSRQSLAKRIEEAMSEAVMAMYAQGITDPEKIKAAMMEAREKVKAEI